MRRLRVGLAGAGMVSAFHLPAWRALGDRVELVAIADPDAACAAARAAAFGVPHTYASLDEMLAGEQLDAVDLMTPPAAHAAHCLAAANAGVAVFCQKPLAPSYQQALHAAAASEHVRVMVHENWRFRPHYRQVQRWLLENSIGTLRAASVTTHSSGLLAGTDGRLPALERQPLLAKLPRMMIAEVLVHHIDIARWLFGADRLQEAVIHYDVPQIAGESGATLNLLTAQGMPVEVGGSMTAVGCSPSLRDTVRIEGERGVISLQHGGLHLSGDQTIALAVDLDADYRESYANAIAHFVDAMLGDLPFETSVAEHLPVLGLVEEAYGCAGRKTPRCERR